MPLEPGHEAVLGTLREKVHDLMAFEIDEDRAVRVAFLEREIVHAEYPHLTDLRQGRGLDPPQQCVAGGHDAQLQGKSCSRLAAEFEGDRKQRLLQPRRFAGAGSDLGQPLAEDPPLARGHVAEEAADADLELHTDAVPGKVRDRARVAAVDPRREKAADRAASFRRPGRYADADSPRLDAQAFEVQTLGSNSWAAIAFLIAACLLTRLDGA